MDENKAQEIINKYLQGTCTEQEKALVERFYLKTLNTLPLPGESSLDLKSEMWQPILAEMRREKIQEQNEIQEEVATISHDPNEIKSIKKKWKSRIQWSAAAAILIIGIASTLWFSGIFPIINSPIEQIVAGGNRATLTLADGSTIELNDDQDGIIIGEKDITYTDGTDLFVIQSDSEGSLSARQVSTLVLTTPNGGQYQVTLPDGTKVWLNAASTLKYPSRFNGTERKVELEGEAYFEVAKAQSKDQKRIPFFVKSDNQKIEVLGTHFNINAYSNETETKTTLLEGSVQVSRIASSQVIPTVLTPGQQSIISGTTIQLKTVNIEEAIAWKQGYISFNEDNLETIMNRIARWYDVDVEYKNANKDLHFGGSVSKYEDIKDVLQRLELTGKVHFKIEGRRIIVTL